MKKWLTILIFLVVVITFSIKIYYDTNHFKVNRVAFSSSKIPENSKFTMLQISDLHNKIFTDKNEKLMNTISDSNADIIVITGDLIDRSTSDFGAVFALIEKITASHEHVYFVSGNHEWDNGNYAELLHGLIERNVEILDNKNKQVAVDGVTLNLVGVDDSSTGHENVDKAFHGMGGEHYTILLSHSPGIIDKYGDIPADLILSGHTHGGQVRIPIIGAVIAPGQGLFPRLEKGIYELDQNKQLYIDSGLGTSIAPIRFMNKSQLSLITVSN
ncbi:metallophosphoesterase [Virgibacillus ainsalahensis]